MNWRLIKHLPLLLKRRSLIPKLLRNYKKLLIDHQPVLRTVDFSITAECPCRCEHCYIAPLTDHTRKPLDLEEKKSAIDQLMELGAVAINFMGGEPMCDPDLPALIAHVPRSEAVAVVTTNALLLDEAGLDRLVNAGLGILAISLDDPEPEGHDAQRGRAGTYAAAMAAIVAAEKRGVETIINSVVDERTLTDGRASRLVDLARKHGAKINIALPAPFGSRVSDGPVPLSEAAAAEMARLRSQSHVRWDGQSNYLRPGCTAGTEKISISAYGDVLPCGGIHLSFGNLRERPLRDIWRDMLARPLFDGQHEGCPLSCDPEVIKNLVVPIRNATGPKPLRAEDFFGRK